ncbi:hypothetical protein FML27_28520 [Klebsiella grimontii]|nr:hypothetical protein [Klebsiella grimontii]
MHPKLSISTHLQNPRLTSTLIYLQPTSAFGTKQTLKTTASDAALAAWRRQMKLHVSVESNGAESPA